LSYRSFRDGLRALQRLVQDGVVYSRSPVIVTHSKVGLQWRKQSSTKWKR